MSSNEPLPIQIKARKDGFVLVPHAEASFETILGFMQQRLEEARDFFHHAQMILDLRERPLRTDEIRSLQSLLMDRVRARITQIRLDEETSFYASPGAGGLTPNPRSVSMPEPEPESTPMIVHSTCRSGTRVESGSDCVILGDVNPGAEVLAVGDVIIFGNLRGIAHAGAAGNRRARIWALSIEPSKLRIADLVAVPPKGNKPVPKRYEIAEIQKDLIEVITV